MARLTKQQLQEKTKNELLGIANNQLGMGLKSSMKKSDIINYIVHNMNRMGAEVPELVDEDKVKTTQNNELPVGYAIIRLDKGKYNPSGHPLYVGSSNKKKQSNCLIPVGKPVKINEKFLEPLTTAVKMEIHQDSTTLDEEEREVHTYPFTILRHNPSQKWIDNHGDDYNLGMLA